MRKALMTMVAGALALSTTPGLAKEKLTGEEQLARMLEGRVAGEPMRCIPTMRNTDLTIIDGTALVYKVGKTLYVNRTAHPRQLDRMDVLVVERFTESQLCRLDQISKVDRMSGFYRGAVFLEDFIPYTLTEEAAG